MAFEFYIFIHRKTKTNYLGSWRRWSTKRVKSKNYVTIPKYGEIYAVEDKNVYLTGRLELENVRRLEKIEIINRIRMLKDEMTDMEDILKNEILAEGTTEDDINRITLRLKEIEKIIVDIIE